LIAEEWFTLEGVNHSGAATKTGLLPLQSGSFFQNEPLVTVFIVNIRQVGDGVLLMPTENAWQIMLDSLDQFSEDIFENGRFHQHHNPATV